MRARCPGSAPLMVRSTALAALGALLLLAAGPPAFAADPDNDGVPDGGFDNCETQYNPSQLDRDGDGAGDACDNCPTLPGPPNGPDADNDGVGDACDLCPLIPSPANGDADADGAGNECDNCPDVPNPGQADGDGDGVGDACDTGPGPDAPVPFLVAPGKTSALPGFDPSFTPQDRIVARPTPTCTQPNGYPDWSCATPEGQLACNGVGAACQPAIVLSTVELGQRTDIQQVFFEWSPDQLIWNPIGPAFGPGSTLFPLDDLGDVPPYRNHPLERAGWWLPWINPALDQLVFVRTTMISTFGASGFEVRAVWIDPTPPVPVIVLPPPLAPVSGLVPIQVGSEDEDIVEVRLRIKDIPEAEKGREFDQGNLGHEEQRKVGPNDDTGANNFCGPTAAKNALHRLASSFPGLFPSNDPDRNLQMAKLLAKKMKTGKATGTSWDNLVLGLRDYLKERGLGCDNPLGYTVTTYTTQYVSNGSGGWAPKSTNATWDAYETEMRDGEAVTLLLLPWDEGDDLDHGTADDSVGYGHYITGKDGQKNGEGPGQHSFSYVDPDDGKEGEATWQTRGGFPSVNYNGRVWIVHGFVAVSPKFKLYDLLDVQPWSFTGATLTFDTRPYPDGVYVLQVETVDAFGNLGRDVIPLEIVNIPPACYSEPDLDGDGIRDDCDNCPAAENELQRDTDGDEVGDACDPCRDDAAISDYLSCPDLDGDGVGDCCDSCPGLPNPAQADSDDDGIGDLCDNCKLDPDPDQSDLDQDGVGTPCDSDPVVFAVLEPELTAPAIANGVVVDPDLPPSGYRRIAIPELRCDQPTLYVNDLCDDPASTAACQDLGGTCRPWVKLQATDLTERDDLVVAVHFAYSLDGVIYVPIGTDLARDDPPPPLLDFPGVPDEQNRIEGSWGWEVPFFDPPEDVMLTIRVRMDGIDLGGSPFQVDSFTPVWVDPTPPFPVPILLESLDLVSGVTTIDVEIFDEDVVRVDLKVLEDDAKNREKKFEQEGLGSEEQGDVGENGESGSNNFCGPTAAKNSLHRLAEKDNRIYNDEEDAKKRNLKMAKKLAEKMGTDKDAGTGWENFVGGIRKYLDQEKVGCNEDDGYTVSEYLHGYTRDDNGTPKDASDDVLRPTKSNFGWDDYEKEMRAGEAVTLLLVPWNAGADGKYGTADDNVEFGHYVSGEDGEKNGNGKGKHEFSYVDPADGKSKETTWQDRGGYPSVEYRGTVWLVAGFVAVSPKEKEEEVVADSQPVSGFEAVTSLTLDTTRLLDGVYLLSFYGYDAAGNAAKTMIPVVVDNHFDVCPGDPGLPDLDLDLIKDPCDNCPGTPNFGQADYDYDDLGDVCDADDDEDGTPDVADCVILDESVWSRPGEAGALRVELSRTTWLWDAPGDAGGTAEPTYDLVSTATASSFVGAACVASDIGDTSYDDPFEPGPGGIAFYLVRAENACGGTLGFTSLGDERAGSACP